jgi:hypothetical protein
LTGQLLIDCFDQAIRILNIRPGSSKYNSEVCREFDSYWRSVQNRKAYSLLNIHDITFREYPMVFSQGVSVIAETKIEAERFLQNTFHLPIDKDTFEIPCIVVRIRNGSNIIHLNEKFKWSTVRRYVVDNTSASVRKQFKYFLDRRVTSIIRYLLLVYPGNEGEILFGFRLEFNNTRRCKVQNSSNCKVENVTYERVDYGYLTLRGGVAPFLSGKNILLLGCGSVGGFIANNLCQAGITSIDILDNDVFMPENVHRHFLGFDAIQPNQNKYKADLLKARLEAQYPFAEIDSMNFLDRRVETFISDPNRLKHYDLIISTLGEPTINIEINKVLKANSINVPLLCCFNEPYGIGGHVIVVNLDCDSCLQCLYTDVISDELIAFRGSLVAPNQNFKKNLSGCSSAFVPYSCMDSQQTAILATRKIIETFNGYLTKNTLFSWLGNSDMFLSQNFVLSEIYSANKDKGSITIYSFANTNCQICNRAGKE